MKCPQCEETMGQEKVLGLTLEVCGEHGVWLEKGDLGKVVSGVQEYYRRPVTDYLTKERDQAEYEGKKKGFFWGMLLG